MQLGEILHTRGVLRIVGGAQLGEIAGGVQGGVEDVGDTVVRGELAAQAGEQLVETGHLRAGARGQSLDGGRFDAGRLQVAGFGAAAGRPRLPGCVGNGGPEGDAVAGGVLSQDGLGLLPQAALGHVEDAA